MNGARRPRISQVHVRGFLSFPLDAEPLQLGSLNVLIGPNGAGKSNLIDVIGLLKSSPTDMAGFLRENGGIGDWLWKGEGRAEEGSVEILVADPDRHPPTSADVHRAPGLQNSRRGPKQALATLGSQRDDLADAVAQMPVRYRLAVTSAGGRPEISDERIENAEARPGSPKPLFFFGYENGRPMLNVRQQSAPRELHREDINPEQSVLSQRKDPDAYPELTGLGEFLAAIRLYRDPQFGRSAAARRPQKTDLPNDQLTEDAANLGLIVSKIRRNAAARKRFTELLTTMYADADDVEPSTEGGTIQLFMHEKGFSTPATRLSDGTIRWICLLAVLLNPSPPPLVCIEEPELGLHPDMMNTLAELLKEAAGRMQLVVTTHSDALIDALNDPDVVMTCQKENGRTLIRRLDKADLARWLEQYTLGELWRKGVIDANRW